MTTQPSTPTRRGREPGGARYLATVLGLPAVVLVTGLGLVAWSWSQLPAMVASHWGPDGVDGTQDRLSFTVTAAVILVVLSLLFAGVGWMLPADGRRLMARSSARRAGSSAWCCSGRCWGSVGSPTRPRRRCRRGSSSRAS